MRLIDADVLLEPIADCEERETCIGCPCRILDCEDFERVLKAAPTLEPTNKVIAEVKVDTDEIMKRVNEEILPLIPQWIPVTERLPEVGRTYIVTGRMKYEWDKKYDYFVDAAAYSPVGGWDTFHDNYEGQQDFAIIAWMPLPEPYEE